MSTIEQESKNQLSRELLAGIVSHWTAACREEEELSPQIPVLVLRGEAVDLAEAVDYHFEPMQTTKGEIPGLISVASRGDVTKATSTELRELEVSLGSIAARQRVLMETLNTAPLERAEEILGEMRAVLSYVLEDGEHPTGQEQLDRLRGEYGSVSSHDGLASALENYGELAAQYKDELSSLGGFDFAILDEILNVARALRQRSADRLTGKLAEEQRDLMRLRNRMVGLLSRKMRNARRAFRYVFRDHPEIAKKSGSEYLRLQRQKHRRTQNEALPEASGEVTVVSAETVSS